MSIETVTSENLTQFNNERMRITPVEAKPEPVKEPAAEPEKAKAVVEEPEAEIEPKEPAEEEPPKKKGNHKIESRFSELTQKARALEERAVAAEARAKEWEAKATPAKAAEPDAEEIGPKPKQADYTDAFLYAEDLAEWSANKALKDRDRQEAQKATDAHREKVVEGWKQRVDAIKAERPEWEEMVASSKAAVSDPARDALVESEFGPHIVGDLAEDDELAEKVSKMKPAEQLRWIGKMEAKYEAKAESAKEVKEEKPEPVVRERPRAPAPIVPVRGGKGAENPVDTPGEFKGTFKEWKAQRLRQMG